MDSDYEILDVTDWDEAQDETLGSKQKVWLRSPEAEEWLLKLPRSGSGEHWAERVAAEVARLLEVPHARVEFAMRGDVMGSISPSFAPRRPESRSLILGNELLQVVEASYEKSKKRPRSHTVELVVKFVAMAKSIAVLDGFRAESELTVAADIVVGYLLLDALIGNTDRHHENWGILVAPADETEDGVALSLAPSFDHASSLGRELNDKEREVRMSTRDRGRTIEAYCTRGRTPFFRLSAQGGQAHSPRSAFQAAASLRPGAARAWIERLRAVDPAALHDCVTRVPASLMSEAAKRFARQVLDCNREHLLGRFRP